MDLLDEHDSELSTRPLKKQKLLPKESKRKSDNVLGNLASRERHEGRVHDRKIDLQSTKPTTSSLEKKSTRKHAVKMASNGSEEQGNLDSDNQGSSKSAFESGEDTFESDGDTLTDSERYSHRDKSTISQDRGLDNLAATTKTVSRIKLRSKDTPESNHHIEHTEISNGKVVDAKSSFATLEIIPWLIVSLAAMEIRRPTAIQKSCIPQILKGQDVIGCSKTGSGKTITFAVPIIQKWAEDPMGIFALVLTATRELALQIFEQFNAISARRSMKIVLITGGTELREQAIALASRPHIVIATPGRLADHINTSGSDTLAGFRRTRIVVLDEADRLLASGPGSMLPDVETCLDALPSSSDRQTCLFTATLTEEVLALKDMPRPDKAPIFVCDIGSESDLAIPVTLQQRFLLVPPVMKEAYLHVLLLTPVNVARKSIIVFCNRTKTADLLERLLRGLDHSVTSLHSKLPQRDRTSNLSRFRARAARILIASDVASRGLDIPEVDLVINYDVPRNPDDYIHRVGRSARAGRKGDSIIMVDRRDIELILAIEARVGQKMTEYVEEGVNIQTRVIRDALKLVGEKKREVIIGIEEGRDVKGNRTRGKIRRLE